MTQSLWKAPAYLWNYLSLLVPPEPELIDSFCKLSDGPVRCMHTIKKFGCVLSWDCANVRIPVRVLHPTFSEYMTGTTRCGKEKWFINIDQHHRRLGMRCLDVIQAKGIQPMFSFHLFSQQIGRAHV